MAIDGQARLLRSVQRLSAVLGRLERAAAAEHDVTVAQLRVHRRKQREEQLAFGPGWNDEQLVFVQEDGTRVHPTRFSHWFTAHAQRAGLPRIRLHDLRHSYATAALSAGIPAKVVSERLGHANVSITLDTYSHVLPALIRRYDGEYSERFEKDNFAYLSLPEKEFPVASKKFEQPMVDRAYFERLTDTFRSPHIWQRQDGQWKLRKAIYDGQ